MFFEPMLSYLADLEIHNNRTWFHETHKRYEKVRKDFEELTTRLVAVAADIAPEMAPRMTQLPVKRFIYRTARDMRYGAGKAPYKTWFACALSDEGREKTAMSYYVQIQPQNRSEICVGVWYTDDRKMTERIRRYISAHAEEFAAIMADSDVQHWFCGDKLSRPPKGFDKNDPMIEYIKYKQWMLFCPIPDAQLTDLDSVVDTCRDVFAKMEPFRAFFAKAVSEAKQLALLQQQEEELQQQEEVPQETKDIFWPTAKSADDWDF